MGRCDNLLGDTKPVALGFAKDMRVCAAACHRESGCTYFQYNNADDSFVCSSIKLADESCPKKTTDAPAIKNRWFLDTHWHTGKLGKGDLSNIDYPATRNNI